MSEWHRLRDAGVLQGKAPGAAMGRPDAEPTEIVRLRRELAPAQQRGAASYLGRFTFGTPVVIVMVRAWDGRHREADASPSRSLDPCRRRRTGPRVDADRDRPDRDDDTGGLALVSAPTRSTRLDVPAHTVRPRRTPRPSNLACKLVMAGTGTVFALFVVVHMVGNLKVYTGPEHFNAYAHWLRTLLEPLLPYEGVLWFLRVVLALCLLGHLWCALVLRRRARRARGSFRRNRPDWRSFSARSMPVTGIVLLLFIVFHLLDLTTGTRPAAISSYTPTTASSSLAYENLVASFDRPRVSAFYVLAMVVLGMHLAHGLWAVVNDLGVTGHRVRRFAVVASGAVAAVVFVANASIPMAVLLGVVR